MNDFLAALLVLVGLFAGAYLVVVLERLVALGPGRAAAAFGLPLARTARLLAQRDSLPPHADRLLFRSAPAVAMVSVGMAALTIPVGPGLVALSSPVALFFFIVVLSPFVIAMMNAGWGQNGKEGLFGAFRAAAHLVSYEVPLGFAAIGPVIAAGSLATTQLVEGQLRLWYAAWQPLGLAIYLVSALFMTYRHPFDIPFAGSELEGGVLGEYSGVRLLIFRLGLAAIYLLAMAMGVVLFFGGWLGPFLPAPLWFLAKTYALSALVLWAGRFLPRLRHDQMLALAWKILVPASLLNVTVVGILALLVVGGSG